VWEAEGGTVALTSSSRRRAGPTGSRTSRLGAARWEAAEDDGLAFVDAPPALKGLPLALWLPRYRCRNR
jgi:hypothetical protein